MKSLRKKPKNRLHVVEKETSSQKVLQLNLIQAFRLNRTIFIRDNLAVLRCLDDKGVDLIYLAPPFYSNKSYSSPIRSKEAGFYVKNIGYLNDIKEEWWGELSDKHTNLYEIIHGIGSVHGDKDKSYLIYITMRLLQMHRILKDTGSIYLHCDQTMSHSLKLIMDAIFGKNNFRNEIIWRRIRSTANINQFTKKNYSKNSDTILFYSKTNDYFFNKEGIKTPYSKEYIKERFKLKDNKGFYQRGNLFRSLSLGERPNLCYTYKGFSNPYPSGWKISKDRLIELDKQGDIEIINNKIYRKLRLEKVKGIPVNNIWEDIYQSMRKEKTGYRTQKSLALLERIVKASCPEGGVVLDPFCGCATTCIASEKLQRKWIGIDINSRTETLLLKRLINDLNVKTNIVTIRKDLPIKNAPKPSHNIKHILYGKQKGHCKGCKEYFPIRNLQKDHIIPKAKCGPDTDANLQLLCGACNSVKGDRDMAYLQAQIKKYYKK